jgi:hypothetical protein
VKSERTVGRELEERALMSQDPDRERWYAMHPDQRRQCSLGEDVHIAERPGEVWRVVAMDDRGICVRRDLGVSILVG